MHADDATKVQIGSSMVSLKEILTISQPVASPDEQLMLDCLATVDSLIQVKEALALFRISKMLPGRAKILEIGSYQGGSTVTFGHAIKNTDIELYSIDMWANYATQDDFTSFDRTKVCSDSAIFEKFLKNTHFIGDNHRVLKGKSTAFAGLLEGKNFDLIFIDGAHDYDSVRKDILNAFAALKPGGFLCGHDFHTAGTGVRRAVNELIGSDPWIHGKGIIEDTHIWCAVVDNPRYQYLFAEIEEAYNAGQLECALAKAQKAYDVCANEELVSVMGRIQQEMEQRKTF